MTRFKFVYSKKGDLYIGLACNDYHMDICGGLGANAVSSAGHLFFSHEGAWVTFGNSVGYGIGVKESDTQKILDKLKDFNEDTLVEAFDAYNRIKL